MEEKTTVRITKKNHAIIKKISDETGKKIEAIVDDILTNAFKKNIIFDKDDKLLFGVTKNKIEDYFWGGW